jgi:hypothetical protein
LRSEAALTPRKSAASLTLRNLGVASMFLPDPVVAAKSGENPNDLHLVAGREEASKGCGGHAQEMHKFRVQNL